MRSPHVVPPCPRPTITAAFDARSSSLGISFSATNHEITLVLAPPGGPKRVVVPTIAPCASLAPRLDARHAAAANESAATTDLTVTFGTQCLRVTATKKGD